MQNQINDWLNRNYKLIVIFLLVAILLWIIMTRKPYQTEEGKLEWTSGPHPSGKYGSSNPGERLKDLVDEFGEPDIIDKTKGGFAIWKKDTLQKRGHCWERVEIHDEQIPHIHPTPHTDFLYTWYKLNVPENKIDAVRTLSESVTYDPLKKIVRARCHFSGANASTLLLVKRIATGEMTFSKAKKAYGPYIFSTIKGHKLYDPKAYDNMVKELCQYQKK